MQHRGVSVRSVRKLKFYEVSVEVIEPGGEIFRHRHPDYELEMVLSGRLHLNGKPVKPGTKRIWKPGMAHGYENRSKVWGEVLSVYFGDWSEEKEILT